MEFDKKLLFDYIKNCDKEYLVNCVYYLYKNYDNLNKLTNNHVHYMAKKINEVEKTIYTINGKIFSDQKKLQLEINLINKKHFNDIKEINILQELEQIQSEINKLDYYDENKIFELKKRISILQGQLKIKPSFLYAAYCSFEDLYKNIYLKHINDNYYDNLKK